MENYFKAAFLTTVLKILEQYRNNVYVSPRVLQQAIVTIEYGYDFRIAAFFVTF